MKLLPFEGFFVDTSDIVEDESHCLFYISGDGFFSLGNIEISQSIPFLHFSDTIDLLIIGCLHKGVMDESDEGLEEQVLLDCALMQEGYECLQGK